MSFRKMAATGVRAMALLFLLPSVSAESASPGLSDPDLQPKFTAVAPNPLDPSFIYNTSSGYIEVAVGEGVSETGLVGPDGNTSVSTPIWGYGIHDEVGITWPGRTFVVQEQETLRVKWLNEIPIEPGYLITGIGNHTGESVVDTSYHWAYSIEGYKDYSIETDGTPIVPHLHGGHSDAPYDGNPEYFFGPGAEVRGPQFVTDTYVYDNSQPAALLWYHDHALGITRLNVYAGMAGFYIVRNQQDTGELDNPLGLPAFPYELPLVFQDRMFKENGDLFYPAFMGDPFYKDFITDEGAEYGDDDPSALAEFFGDHMIVNGKIWPKVDVEPRKYRLRLLNGCDSRFVVAQFLPVPPGLTDFAGAEPISFVIIGGDQGFATEVMEVDTLVSEPSSRYDIIFDFSPFAGQRVIMSNTGGDEPFGGDIPGPQAFKHTDKIMAFDVSVELDASIADNFSTEGFNAYAAQQGDSLQTQRVDRVRKLGLFEGHDQFGRLQPLLGTAEPATDMNGNPINWPDNELYKNAGLVGPMEGTATWHAPTTENPRLYDTEEWEIWNVSADAHPIHLHLVHFIVVSRKTITFDSNVNEDGEIELHEGQTPAGDGTYTIDMPLVQHDGSMGEGYKIMNPTVGEEVLESELPEYVHNFPRDVVTALPGQITTIRAYFDKPGRFNWHCHILSHEDHEMMRVYHVGELPTDGETGDAEGDESVVEEDTVSAEDSRANNEAANTSAGNRSSVLGPWNILFGVLLVFW